jgi:HEAT repeat protein
MARRAPKDIQELLEILRSSKSSDDELCDTARDLIVLQSKSREVTEALWARINLREDPPWVREELLAALGSNIQVNDPLFPQVVNLMQRTLVSADEDEAVRVVAAVALGVFGNPDFAEAMIKVLEEEMETRHVGLMVSCVMALKMLKEPSAIGVLERTLTLRIPVLAIQSAEALSSLGSLAQSALPSLRMMATDGTDAERRSAAEAICSIEET